MTSLIARLMGLGAKTIFTGAVLLSVTACSVRPEVVNYEKDARKTGLKEYSEGNYASAAGSFKAAARSEPRDYKAYYWMGASYQAMKSYEQAITSYKSALDVMPLSNDGRRDTETRYKIFDGLAFAIANSPTRHVELDQYEQKNKANATAEGYFVLAKVYRWSQDPDSSIENYNRAILLDPNNDLMTREYGLYLAELGQTAKAESTLRRAYSLNSHDQEVALALRRLGVVPGPGVKEQRELAQPLLPRGPLPDLGPQTSNPSASSKAQPAGARTAPSGAPTNPQVLDAGTRDQ